jgi:hypothetical protein
VPRIRSVHPDVVDDDVVADMSPYAFRTWVLLWTHLDDEGRGLDSAKLWAGKLYSLNDKMTSERVEKDLSELEERGLLVRYEVDGRRYLSAKPGSWKKYQKPQHPTPSKLPPIPPPEVLMSNSGAPHPGEELEVEGSCIGEEGESEGESEHAPEPDAPVDNPIARSLQDRCATVPQRVSRRPSLSVVKGQGAAETPAAHDVRGVVTNGAHS